MKKAFNRVISIVLVFFGCFSAVPMMPYAAEIQETACPYVLFAGSDEEGAISLFTGNTCVNGNICTNGKLSAQGHINMNGTITEDADVEMPDLWQWIVSREKSGDVISHDGNIDIYEDVRLCNENVLACENGDITINCSQAEINSLVYAPGGTVSISAGNLNMNNVIIIAERIVINSPNVNANYNSTLGKQIFVTKKENEDDHSDSNNENNGENNGTDERNLYTVTFDLCGISDTVIPDQCVYEGDFVVVQEEPEAEGYMFLGWDKDPEHKQYFDPEKDAVTENLHLYAYWYNEMDETDTDEDGILDELEKLLELDPYSDDSDGDGLPDNMETDVSIMDATKYDTDGNGIADGEEDFDGDALKNVDEIDLGTNFCDDDTDNDGLSDGDEYLVYGTDPLNIDTDEDGVDDFKEISLGTDPLVCNTLFDVVYMVDKDDYEEADIDFSVSLHSIDAEQADSLDVMPVINDTLFPTDMPGYMGCAYDISMPGTFEEAVLIFEFAPDKYGDDVDPVVYYFDEEEQELIPYDTTVSGNKAIAVTNHFSKYILIDRGKFDKNRELYDKWGDVDFSNLEVMFLFGETISNNMPDVMSKREEDLFDLIDLIPDNAEIGEVAIGYDAAAYGGFINN